MLRTVWIASFADLIYVMTAGGPASSTNTIATYIYVQTFKSMGKSAYPHLIGFIDDDELGTTAVLILKELSGRSDAPSRVTPATCKERSTRFRAHPGCLGRANQR